MSDAMNIDDIAKVKSPGPEGDSFDFDEPGETVKGKVVHFDTIILDDKFNPGRRNQKLIISLEQADGSVLKIWPVTKNDVEGEDPYPDRMAKAIVAAIKAAGATALEVGGTLEVKFTEWVPTKYPKPTKGYVAGYQPPVAAASVTSLISE